MLINISFALHCRLLSFLVNYFLLFSSFFPTQKWGWLMGAALKYVLLIHRGSEWLVFLEL